MEKVKCPQCGKQIPKPWNVCPYCGYDWKVKSLSRPSYTKKTSDLWYLMPIFFALLGGIIAYAMVKDRDKEMAKTLLLTGVLVTFIGIFAISYYISLT